MASRDLKEHVYIEALEDAITNVEMIENHLERLSDENKVVAMHILRKDRIKTILSLELALSTYCILLRKMQENHFISYSDAIRMDINSIIHSNRFEYYDGEIIVFSARGREDVDLNNLLDFGRSILQSIDQED
ncbi:hypothetical protein [Sharpea azabuensis]|uniref:hypothetical protein n=1 Tax=Sharpea azabuensis TaxID=322505 RepID=UPI0015662CDB|nr:hypothetical protein [Sharpea azabuensis]MEE3307699.1 hypothetical protein [Sharpea azabuensis]